MKKIDFIGVGVPRSATTWLGECLAEHPEIDFSSEFYKKEINFFSVNYDKGIKWYLNLFPNDKSKIQGEFSPTYIWNPETAERIKKHFPDVKLILSLRNPIDMIYSLYWMGYNAIQVYRPESFDEAVKNGQDEELQLKRALYSESLDKFFRLFPRKNIFVIFYEEIVENPQSVLKDLYQFLGVNEDFVPNVLKKKVNTTEKTKNKFLKNIFSRVLKILRNSFLVNVANWFISNLFLYKIYSRLNKKNWEYPPMKKETRKILANYYYSDIKKVEKLTNRDLSQWLKQ